MDKSEDNVATDDQAILKPKTKREQSEKQKEVWARAQKTRLENAKLKKEALAKAKEEIENKRYKPSKKPVSEAEPSEPYAKKAPTKVVYESDSEPEVVIVKKKKKKQVVYEESSSESEPEPPPPPKKKKSVAPVETRTPMQRVEPIIRFF